METSLELLRNNCKRLLEECNGQRNEIGNKLKFFFTTMSEGVPLELLPIYPWIPTWGVTDTSFKIDIELRFKAYKKERIEKGFENDFGSEITLHIDEEKIQINRGCIGTYGKDDLGQISRDMLIPKIWENEETIIAICKNAIDPKVFIAYNEAQSELTRIEDAIKKAEDAKETLKILEQIRSSKYLCDRNLHEINRRWDDEKQDVVCDGKEYCYFNYQEIIKITDKTLITNDVRTHDKHVYKLPSIIGDIKYGRLFLRNDIVRTERIVEEGAL